MTPLTDRQQRGFSLLEMVIYVAILAFLLVVIVNIIFSIVGAQKTLSATRSVQNTAIFSLESMSREVRGAMSIDEDSSTFDTSPGVLVLNTTDTEGSPEAVTFFLSGGAVHISRDGVDQGALSDTEANVSSLIFHLISADGVAGVRTEFVVESGTSTSYRTGRFYTSAIIRNLQ